MHRIGFLNSVTASAENAGGGAAPKPQPAIPFEGAPQEGAHDTKRSKAAPGSHNDIIALLERHDREWKKAYQSVEEKRILLCKTEDELLNTCNQVEVTIPIFQQVEQDLQTAMLESNALEMPAELVGLFDMSGGIAQQLETLGRALSDVVARRRSAWEEYSQSVKEARRMLHAPAG